MWAFVESFRATLAGDQEALKRFYSISLEGSSEQWLLTMHPIEAKMKNFISEIRITGSLAQIHTIETREKGGDYSVMTISPTDSNSNLKVIQARPEPSRRGGDERTTKTVHSSTAITVPSPGSQRSSTDKVELE